MRFFNNRFPYTTMNDINLDWIIKKIKALMADVAGHDTEIAEAKTAAETAQATADNALETAAGKQDAPATPGEVGQVLGLDAELQPVWVDQTGGGGGTNNYNSLNNKPSINGVTLAGNKTAADLGLATASALNSVDNTALTALSQSAEAIERADTAQETADGKQAKIAASGVLYGEGGGTVRAATLGTEYGSKTYSAALLASSWASNRQVYTNVEIVNNINFSFIISPAPASIAEYERCGVRATGYLSGGGLVFECDRTPTTNITIYILRDVTTAGGAIMNAYGHLPKYEFTEIVLDSTVTDGGYIFIYRYGPFRFMVATPNMRAAGLWQVVGTLAEEDRPGADVIGITGGYDLQNGEFYVRTTGAVEFNVKSAGYAKGVTFWAVNE